MKFVQPTSTLSLTPGFSRVMVANRTAPNRFNGFKFALKKPLKRFASFARVTNTPLKQGVNENERFELL